VHTIKRQALPREVKEPTPPTLRKKTKTKHLTLEQMIEISHRVFIRKDRLVDVAREFSKTPGRIS